MPVCRTNDGTASALCGTSVRAPTATMPNAISERRIVGLRFSTRWTCFGALLLNVLQDGLYFSVLEPEVGHLGVVVLGEERFGDRIGVQHQRRVRQPAA